MTKPKPKISSLKTKILSASAGYQLAPEKQKEYFDKRYRALLPYEEDIKRMYNEPTIMDDAARVPLQQYVEWAVTRCETLIHLDGEKVVAFSIFVPATGNRSGDLIVWVAPEYRSGFANQRKIREFMHDDVLDYAWNRLKWIRIETRMLVSNRPGLCLAKNAKFSFVGIARMDCRINGALFDSVILECLNPAYIVPEVEVITHEEREHTNRELASSPRVHAGPSAEFDSGEDADEWADNDPPD